MNLGEVWGMKKWNWRSYAAGMVTATMIFGITGGALAATSGNVSFNTVNISANGVSIAKEGSGYGLQNGAYAPYSITYTDAFGGGTTYVPISKLSEFTGTGVSWDASTNTVQIDAETTAAYDRLTGNSTSYDSGYDAGYQAGLSARSNSRNYDAGYDDGYDDGYDEARDRYDGSGSYSDGYDDGYYDGYYDGRDTNNTSNGSYNDGYNDGYEAGEDDGYDKGYDAGLKDGQSGSGTTDRYQEGYDAGFAAGKAEGKQEGYREGYEDGYSDGETGEPSTPGEPGEDDTVNRTIYYEGWNRVPSFENVVAPILSPEISHSPDGVSDMYRYSESKDQNIVEYETVLKNAGFSEINTYNSDGGDLLGMVYEIKQYCREGVYVNIGRYSGIYTIVMITPYQVSADDFGFPRNEEEVSVEPFDRESVSEDDLLTYIKESVGTTLSTPTGEYEFEITVYKNNDMMTPYDFRIEVDWSSNLSWYDLKNSMDISETDRKETLETLIDYQQKIYEAAYEIAPGAKLEGCFYNWWYKWDLIEEGFRRVQVFSWQNYAPDELVYAYEKSVVVGFYWATGTDDYKFSDYLS